MFPMLNRPAVELDEHGFRLPTDGFCPDVEREAVFALGLMLRLAR